MPRSSALTAAHTMYPIIYPPVGPTMTPAPPLKQAKTGEPYSYSNPVPKEPMTKKTFTVLAFIEALVGLLFGKGYASKLRASMNTAVTRTEATEYIDKSSFNLTNSSDMYLYSNVTRTPIPTETRSGGGSSIHTSSGGHSHSGGGGRF